MIVVAGKIEAGIPRICPRWLSVFQRLRRALSVAGPFLL
jgi:hypothetical protein